MAPPIIKRFIISLEQNQLIGFLVFLAALGASVVVAMLPDPPPPSETFRARGELTFRTPPPAFTSTGSTLQAQGRSINREILLSGRVLQQSAQRLNFTGNQISEIIERNRLKITLPNRGTEENEQSDANPNRPQTITLEYTDPGSKTQAEAVLRTFMEEMVDYSRWLNTYQLRSKISGLEKRLGEVKVDLTKAERRFYDYISQQGTEILAIQDGSLFSGITSSQQQQRELKLALDEIEGQINSLIQQLGLNPQQAYTAVALSADPILANLRAAILETELQLERVRLDLKEEHPTIKQLVKEKQVNELLLQQRAEELIGEREFAPVPSEIRKEASLDPNRQQLASQLLVLETQQAGLREQLASSIQTEQELRDQYNRFPDQQLQQAQLVQEVEFQRVVYQNILTALVDAQAAEAETVGSLTIATEAAYIPRPAPTVQSKNRYLIITIGGGVGILGGLGVIFLLAMIDDRLHTVQELRSALSDRDLTVLGEFPEILTLSQEDEPPIIDDLDSPYLPFYERCRSSLRRLGTELSKVMVVTSISNGAGKTITAYNLAVASAFAGKRTLLIEADLRMPSQSSLLGVNPDRVANIEPLKYYAARSEAIQLVPGIANLYILPSSGPQRQASAILESSEFQLFLKDARGRFDVVILDAPSLSRCNDALLLEPFSDGLLLVTCPGITRSSLLEEASDQFAEAEISVLGAVINRSTDSPEASITETVLTTDTPSEEAEVNAEGEKVEV
ncbi:MAG: AAA family ATPase [Microcystaceae cyanobacterium]